MKHMTGKVGEVSREWEELNRRKPLRLSKSVDVTSEARETLYESFPNDWEERLDVLHFRVDSQPEFRV